MLIREVAVAAVEIVFDIESVTSVWRPELGREERLHGKCGDWRTSLSYPALRLKRKPPKLLILLTTLFRQPRANYTGAGLSINSYKTDMGESIRETVELRGLADGQAHRLVTACIRIRYFSNTIQ